MDDLAKGNLATDFLSGLAFLHGKGFMHRDLTLKNLAVVTLNPPRGGIIDFDTATREAESRDHMRGTTMSLAPEIIALKEVFEVQNSQDFGPSKSGRLYPNLQGLVGAPGPLSSQEIAPNARSVDVWALGMCVFSMCSGHRFDWRKYAPSPQLKSREGRVNCPCHIEFRRFLDHVIAQSVQEDEMALLQLIERMIRWVPEDRVPSQILLSSVQEAFGKEGKRASLCLSKAKRELWKGETYICTGMADC